VVAGVEGNQFGQHVGLLREGASALIQE